MIYEHLTEEITSGTAILDVVSQKLTCSVCESSNLEEIVELKQFPFTGFFVKEGVSIDPLIEHGIDQSLVFCPKCGHAQLRSIVNPRLVYDDTYSHRGSKSPIARQGNEFFASFVKEVFPDRHFNNILDVGCNDGYLLETLSELGSNLCGVDPIWIGEDCRLGDKVKLTGGFAEDICVEKLFGTSPDLVVSAHTFEHIENPQLVLEYLLSQTQDGTCFVIEVPSLDTMAGNYRFDQVFHQHIQYFSLASMTRLIERLDCEYIAHTFNYKMWGGTMLVAFRKKICNQGPNFKQWQATDLRKSFAYFSAHLQSVSHVLTTYRYENLYGFGAAQMLPSFAYHMPDQMGQITHIIDDDPLRQGKRYPGFDFSICSSEGIDFQDATILITALDSMRPLASRLTALNTKRILLPTLVC